MHLYKNLKKREEELLTYIRENPGHTHRQIRDATSIKVERVYPHQGMKQLYLKADIPFSLGARRRSKQQMLRDVIYFIQQKPSATTIDIKRETGVDIPKTFKTIEAAYEAAGVIYPKRRVSGSALPNINKRAQNFEKGVLKALKQVGGIKEKIKLFGKREADALFYYNNKEYVIEIKNYVKRRITLSEIKQVLSYMLELQCKQGLLIHSYDLNKIKTVQLDDYSLLIVSYQFLLNSKLFKKSKTYKQLIGDVV